MRKMITNHRFYRSPYRQKATLMASVMARPLQRLQFQGWILSRQKLQDGTKGLTGSHLTPDMLIKGKVSSGVLMEPQMVRHLMDLRPSTLVIPPFCLAMINTFKSPWPSTYAAGATRSFQRSWWRWWRWWCQDQSICQPGPCSDMIYLIYMW